LGIGLGRLHWCWAHPARDFQALADSQDGVVRRLGHDLLRPTRELFCQWSRCRDGTISRAELNHGLAPVRGVVEGLPLRGLFSGHSRLVGMCRELYEHREWLWTFLEQEVEPTNNASERALRHAVIWRKLSFGTWSAGGSRFVETMLTLIDRPVNGYPQPWSQAMSMLSKVRSCSSSVVSISKRAPSTTVPRAVSAKCSRKWSGSIWANGPSFKRTTVTFPAAFWRASASI
jgi:transposase IS66 family protein